MIIYQLGYICCRYYDNNLTFLSKTNMAYSKTFSVIMSDNLFEILELIAIEKGYTNSRKLIAAETRKIASLYKDLQACAGKRSKRQRNYQLPDHLRDSLENLSCVINTPIATIIIMHLMPEILKHIPQAEDQAGSEC